MWMSTLKPEFAGKHHEKRRQYQYRNTS